MKITKLETIRLREFPNILWVRVHGEEGLDGLGETFMARGRGRGLSCTRSGAAPPGPGPAARSTDASSSPAIVGFRYRRGDARQLGGRHRAVGPVRQGDRPAGVPAAGRQEPRAIRIYNTCAGYQYIRGTRPDASNWGLRTRRRRPVRGPAKPSCITPTNCASLLEGRHGMKIWPFDPAAEARAALHLRPPTSTRRWSRSARSARRSATGWTSWSSSTPCGTCRWRDRSPAR